MIDRERLIQEEYVGTEHGAWKVLVVCHCLNRCAWMTAEKVIAELLNYWPSPDEMAMADREELLDVVRPLGFGAQRVERLKDMSRQYVNASNVYGDLKGYNIRSLAGCGEYAEDAWKLFVMKERCRPKDRRLEWYARREKLWI